MKVSSVDWIESNRLFISRISLSADKSARETVTLRIRLRRDLLEARFRANFRLADDCGIICKVGPSSRRIRSIDLAGAQKLKNQG
jgi:hypothetical protein